MHSGSFLQGLLPEGDHLILDEAGSPYTSKGSLIIDGQLEILPNVTIRMDKGSTLLIRKGGVKAVGTSESPIVLEKLTDRWSGVVVEKKIKVSPGFKLLLAYNGDNVYSVGSALFNDQFLTSQSKTLVRYCPNCYSSHAVIFYKRITNVTNFEAYDAMTCNFTAEDNSLNSDFGA